MRLLTDERQWGAAPTVVAFGTFDGVHLGHRQLMQEAVRLGRERGIASMVYTYSNHPMCAFSGMAEPPQLETLSERIASIEETGIDAAVVRPFTKAYAQQSPRAFLEGIVAAIHPRIVIIGYNYSFGDHGRGKAEDMIRFGQTLGFETIVVGEVRLKGETVSSTRIRQALFEGDVRLACALLGHPYQVSGTARPGRQIGSAIGYATANLDVPTEKLLPKDGVYLCEALLDGQRYPAITSLGQHPTVPGNPGLEAHLLGYTGTPLYQKQLRLAFYERLRSERQFDTMDALRAQIQRDECDARAYFRLDGQA